MARRDVARSLEGTDRGMPCGDTGRTSGAYIPSPDLCLDLRSSGESLARSVQRNTPVLGVAHPDDCGNDSGNGGQDQQDSMWHGRAPYCSSLWLSTIGWVGRTIRPESS